MGLNASRSRPRWRGPEPPPPPLRRSSPGAAPGGSASSEFPPNSDYGLIGNCRSCALVASDGSVEWACFGRFDARPVFARILDRGVGGFFRIAPAGGHRAQRRYVPGTNVLETTFHADRGTISVTDRLPLRGDPDVQGASIVEHPDCCSCAPSGASRAPWTSSSSCAPGSSTG